MTATPADHMLEAAHALAAWINGPSAGWANFSVSDHPLAGAGDVANGFGR